MYKRGRNGDYFHVTFDNNKRKWQVKKVGTLEVKICNTKEDAVQEAKKLSYSHLMGHVVIHNENGKFESL